MIRFILFLTPLLSFFACDKILPIPSVEGFEKSYGDSLIDYGSAAVLVGNDIFITGTSTSFSSGGDKDLYLLKIDEDGNQLFQKTYGGGLNDFGFNVIGTSDGNLLLLGLTNSYGVGYDIFLVKVNLAGDTLWQKNYGGAGYDSAKGIIETDDGGILILGPASNGSTTDFRTLRLDAQGNELWQKNYSSPYNDSGLDIAAAGNDEYLLFGRRQDGDSDFYTIKVDGQGDTLWTATYGGPDYEEGHSIFRTQDDGFVLCGHSASQDPLHNFYGVKIDQNGTMIWENHYGGGVHDGSEDGIELSSGDMLLIGETDSYGNGTKHGLVIRTDASGQLIGETSFGGDLPDKFVCVIESNTAIYCIGETASYASAGVVDVYVVKRTK
jgi:hypothetical protein